jgi:PTS system nitrogen regulatory IIA component
MRIADLIEPAHVLAALRVQDKPQLLAELARRSAAAIGIDPGVILSALRTREQLGSTGLGHGFALPHARIDGLTAFFGLFARLARPIDFEAIDSQPVDLVFLLLIPPDANAEHVAALAAIARPIRDRQFVRELRQAKDATELVNRLASA